MVISHVEFVHKHGDKRVLDLMISQFATLKNKALMGLVSTPEIGQSIYWFKGESTGNSGFVC